MLRRRLLQNTSPRIVTFWLTTLMLMGSVVMATLLLLVSLR